MWYNYGMIKPYKGGDFMPQIIPIKDLKNTAEVSELCHSTSEPIFITKNGYGDMVLMSMETFERTMALSRMYQDLDLSEQNIKEGRIRAAKGHLDSLKEKYGL